MDQSAITQFYKSQNVFITGGTGYIGMLLIEKLLRSTDVNKIYILVRRKDDKDPDTRINELLENIVFEKLKKQRPDIKKSIHPILGDCSEKGLGMSAEDRKCIIDNVNIIFHNAANIKLTGNLEEAYYTNVRGSLQILELAEWVEKLKCVMYVSTAYSNSIYPEIGERIYESPCPNLKEIVEGGSREEINKLVQKILRDWPDMYAFTKSVTESLIKEKYGGLPICIFRPAVVGVTYKEPLAGWSGNRYGATGVLAGELAGVIRVLPFGRDCTADVVPGDFCVAGLIAAGWEVGTKQTQRSASPIPIYNFAVSSENPITWGQIDMLSRYEMRSYPSINSMWTPCLLNLKNKTLSRLIFHYMPALMIDVLSCLTLRKPKMVSFYRKIHKFMDGIMYYSENSWIFHTNNTMSLWDRMNETDKRLFPMNMKDLNWLEYFRIYIRGLRLYILKDPMSTLKKAKIREKRLIILHEILKALVTSAVMYTIWFMLLSILNLISNSL